MQKNEKVHGVAGNFSAIGPVVESQIIEINFKDRKSKNK